jgi:hypothetical protein
MPTVAYFYGIAISMYYNDHNQAGYGRAKANRVFIESGVPTWPNGFDLDPIQLYMELRDAGLLTKPNATAAE